MILKLHTPNYNHYALSVKAVYCLGVLQFGGETEGRPSRSLRGALFATKQSPNAREEIASLRYSET
jgi:hypothetical protein